MANSAYASKESSRKLSPQKKLQLQKEQKRQILLEKLGSGASLQGLPVSLLKLIPLFDMGNFVSGFCNCFL